MVKAIGILILLFSGVAGGTIAVKLSKQEWCFRLTPGGLLLSFCIAALGGVFPLSLIHIYSNLGRYVALAAGLPEKIPAYTVQKQDASGMQAVINGYAKVKSGNANIILCLLYTSPLEDARDYSSVGCAGIQPTRKEKGTHNAGYLNVASALEFALHDGYWKKGDKQVSIHTGDARQFKSFQEVMDAFEKQLSYLIKIYSEEILKVEKAHRDVCPTPFISSFIQDCIGTVSYTHLDVYKRQSLVRVKLYNRHIGCFNPICRSFWHFCLSAGCTAQFLLSGRQ